MGIPVNKKAIADFHIHTKESDGVFAAPEYMGAAMAKNPKLRYLAFTDHQTTAAYKKYAALAEHYGIEVFPGIEISAGDANGLHILGHGMTDIDKIEEKYQLQADTNKLKLYKMIDTLSENGIVLSNKFINHSIENDSLSRSAIAIELVKMGVAPNFKKAYKNWAGPDGLAGFQTLKPSAIEAIADIRNAGGFATLAHPWQIRTLVDEKKLSPTKLERLVQQLTNAGLRGIESLPRSYYKKEDPELKYLAENFGLVEMGGSDMHGNRKDISESLGNHFITEEHVEIFKNEIENANRRVRAPEFKE